MVLYPVQFHTYCFLFTCIFPVSLFSSVSITVQCRKSLQVFQESLAVMGSEGKSRNYHQTAVSKVIQPQQQSGIQQTAAASTFTLLFTPMIGIQTLELEPSTHKYSQLCKFFLPDTTSARRWHLPHFSFCANAPHSQEMFSNRTLTTSWMESLFLPFWSPLYKERTELTGWG